MKKLITILLVCITSSIYSQLSITTDTSFICKWKVAEKEWQYETYPHYYTTMFKINEAGTIIEHTTLYNKSSYYVNSLEDKIKEYGWCSFDVTSDTGNSYVFVIDKKNRVVKCIYKYNDELYSTFYKIIKIF